MRERGEGKSEGVIGLVRGKGKRRGMDAWEIKKIIDPLRLVRFTLNLGTGLIIIGFNVMESKIGPTSPGDSQFGWSVLLTPR